MHTHFRKKEIDLLVIKLLKRKIKMKIKVFSNVNAFILILLTDLSLVPIVALKFNNTSWKGE